MRSASFAHFTDPVTLVALNLVDRYSCGGWAARNIETSARTALNEVLVNMMNRTLSTANLDASEYEPYRNLILFYRSCIEFHTTTMPTDVRVRKALYLLDLSFTEWLHHNQEPIILFYFMIRLSLSQVFAIKT